MAGVQNRTAAELKADLTAAIEQSRALLSGSQPESDRGMQDHSEPGDLLTGMELSFDEPPSADKPGPVEEIDFSTLSDEALDEILADPASADPGLSAPLAELKAQIARNPLPWAIGALVIGAAGARLLLGSDSVSNTKNARQNASQSANSAITHGSLLGQIMKTVFEMAKPTLLEGTKGWLMRIVDKKR